jgi:hypothetical protein
MAGPEAKVSGTVIKCAIIGKDDKNFSLTKLNCSTS